MYIVYKKQMFIQFTFYTTQNIYGLNKVFVFGCRILDRSFTKQ